MQASELFISGPLGQLEAILTRPTGPKKPIIGIICHPNPTQQGTMMNKVVTIIAQAFDRLGVSTLRFNYRGVGRSEGFYGEVKGEIEDLKAVMDWVGRQWPNYQIWLAGFSFGSFITAYVTNHSHGVARLISVAPAVNWHDFTALTHIHCPWLVIASDCDEIVPFAELVSWAKHPPSPIALEVIKGASHFFHGQLIELRERLVQKLAD